MFTSCIASSLYDLGRVNVKKSRGSHSFTPQNPAQAGHLLKCPGKAAGGSFQCPRLITPQPFQEPVTMRPFQFHLDCVPSPSPIADLECQPKEQCTTFAPCSSPSGSHSAMSGSEANRMDQPGGGLRIWGSGEQRAP